MPYTEEEGGRINNFAAEPKMYTSKPPTTTEKRKYIIGAIVALALLTGVLFVAFSVS